MMEEKTANVCPRKEIQMNKAVSTILAATIASFVAIPAAWAAGDPQTLSKQCQDALKKTPNAEASKLCSDGDKALSEGKKDEATAKLTAGLEKLGVKAPTAPATAPAGKPGY
jgi:outer membrane protein assembly factor BamD (BamD/ComL family)